MWLGAHAPARSRKLVLCNTAARIGTAETWNARIDDGRAGTAWRRVAAAMMERWFTPAFRAQPPGGGGAARSACSSGQPAEGYVGVLRGHAGRRPERGDARGRSARRTLVIAGRRDPATPPAEGRAAGRRASPGARYVELDAVAPLEPGGAASRSTPSSCGSWPPEEERRWTSASAIAAGLAVRRAVLGDAHVDRAPGERHATFDREFQDLITRYAWGEIWTRPGLPRKHAQPAHPGPPGRARPRATSCACTCGRRSRNGVTPDEIKEVLLQAAVYCGVPAAHAAFHLAEEVLAEKARRGRPGRRGRARERAAEAGLRSGARGPRPRQPRAAPRTRSTGGRRPPAVDQQARDHGGQDRADAADADRPAHARGADGRRVQERHRRVQAHHGAEEEHADRERDREGRGQVRGEVPEQQPCRRR